MAFVNPITNVSPTRNEGSWKVGDSDLGKDTFFRLLITQLQNQSPLNPMDSTEFTTQLAQFSQLEQLNNMNSKMGFVQLYLASLNNAQAVDFIGREIEAKGNTIYLSGSGGTNLNYELMEDASKVTIKIYDEKMQLVRIVEQGSQGKGIKGWIWDGKDNQGRELPAGKYTFEVSATNLRGEEVKVQPYLKGVVTSVTFEGGITYLHLGDQRVTISDIVKVHDRPEEQTVKGEASQSKTEKIAEVMRELGKFMKNAAPIAAMFI